MRQKTWILVIAIITLATALEFFNEPDAKKPGEEEVILKEERKLNSGQVVYVQILRCKRCGKVISYVEFNKAGYPIGGFDRPVHICGPKFGRDENYNGMDFGPKHFDFLKWLEHWQRRLQFK